ncbi:MAG: hypothetical protein RLZZ630_763, partial [Bacteroidota bacterium]
MKTLLIPFLTLSLLSAPAFAQKKSTAENAPKKEDRMSDATFRGLSFRSIGPAVTSGRIADIAVNPLNPNEYYLAVASGGV